jgi:hypothetical protein
VVQIVAEAVLLSVHSLICILAGPPFRSDFIIVVCIPLSTHVLLPEIPTGIASERFITVAGINVNACGQVFCIGIQYQDYLVINHHRSVYIMLYEVIE